MAAYSLPKRLLHWYAVVAAASVSLLICSGGLVTSHEAGMAVPDWPNTFGYNMFLFPVSRWVGGVFFEHTHRLIASTVGLLTVILCVALFIIEERRWVKTLGVIAVAAVVVQGILGGLRVTENNPVLGLFHGCLAQSFFALMATIALVTSRFWERLEQAGTVRNEATNHRSTRHPAGLASEAALHKSPLTSHLSLLTSCRRWVIAITGMVFLQLALGASMRHSHAGLSIPDFPLNYGHLFPPLDSASIDKINQARGAAAQPYTSAWLILLQYVHRIWAVLIVAGLVFTSVRLLRNRFLPLFFRRCASVWILLVFVQFCLGAWTVLSNKAADVATAHVFCGALTLMLGVLLAVSLSGLLHYSHKVLSHSSLSQSIELGTV
ncbi:MAG: COX15/CtaA family protein [Verrucomicrobia bacterium]|nr:COX15/CtaA family protein [Verrucomicrobiota bacterium]MBV8483357.1 COX15/CtaA family protein [Verrucomicrobiota bacterium]